MADMQIVNRKDPYSYTFYILLEGQLAKKQEKDYHSYSYSQNSTKYLLKGEILIRNLTTVVDSTNRTLRLHPYDKATYFCECPVDNINPLEDEEAKLLLSFKSNDERYKFFIDSTLNNGKKMTVGSHVYVKIRLQGGGMQELLGIIRYKGSLPKEDGTMFGVELLEGKGRGTTNGLFRGTEYFHCDNDCGVFVALEKLRLYEGTKENMLTKLKNKLVEGFSNLMSQVEQTSAENILDQQDKHTGHKTDDIVWVHMEDEKLCKGVLKYIGRVPGGRETLAGIHMDEPVGLGNGEYYGNQLFTCPMNHAYFTAIENVMSLKQRNEIYGQSQDITATSCMSTKDSHSSASQSSEDVLKMESNFSKQSKDTVINEQEKILKQIKEQKLAERKNLHDNNSANSKSLFEELQKTKTENQTNFNHVSHAAIKVNGQLRDQTSPPSTNNKQMPITSLQSDLEIGSMVEVLSKNQKPKYGVIRWIGFMPSTNKKVAGLELDEEMDACTDGTFLGKRYFECPNRRGFFVHLHNCKPDSRFLRNSLQNFENKRLSGTEFGHYDSPIIDLDRFTPPPKTMEIYLKQEGAGKEEAKGIQGHHNSCYLDATLFAAFAFSSVMDSILLRPQNKNDIEEYEKVQTVLRNKIVYPLRSCGFVRADRVLELRQLLDRLGTVTGLVEEEKDPEEFLTTLLEQVLKTEPFIKVKSGKEVNPAYFYQVLADKDSERVLPSVEELLKKSFHQTEVKLTELPSCLLVQMPRFGKGFKMYKRILPSLTINIGQLVENYPQDCAVCGRLAKHYCTECFRSSIDVDCSGNYCMDCNKRVHSNVKRNKHNVIPIAVSRPVSSSFGDRPVEHHEMELFAVICIETSHYVTFAKCEEPGGTVKWCFFDSMADRVGAQNGYNVPAVIECPEVIEWLSAEKENRQRIINTDDKDMPDRVRRLLGDAYVCLYASKEMAMYK